jgi:hypothetical protein
MRGGGVTMVRGPLRVRERSRRTLDQAIGLRFPALAAAGTRLAMSLPLGSRLRRAIIWRTARLAVEAFNRRDLDAVAIIYHPDMEYYPYREFVEGGLSEACYRGPEGYKAYIGTTIEAWGEGVQLHPTELIDLGDRFVILADMPMRAQTSGVPLAESYATVTTLAGGSSVSRTSWTRARH